MVNVNQFVNQFQNQVNQEDYQIIIKFILTFSRFENAICRLGWLKPNGNADWDRYSDSVDGNFQIGASVELQTANNFLLNQPPRKVKYRPNGDTYLTVIRFNDPNRPNPSDCYKIIRYIQQVRHNLFHGSKYPYLVRDANLVKHSLVVLDYLLTVSSGNFLNNFWAGFQRA